MTASLHPRPRRTATIPATLTVAIFSASALIDCAPASVSCGPADAGVDACVAAREDDGAVRYTVCPSQVNCECARVIYPDGAVADPTFC